MVRLCSIASGSSGNCVYAGTDETHLLVDAGVSGKRIESGLRSLSVEPDMLSGIFVTHEHVDHIQGIGILARRYHVPIYATAETLRAMTRAGGIGKVDEALFRPIKPDEPLEVGDIRVNPFAISHDAANPVCYTFEACGHKIGMATDLGTYDGYLIERLSGCEILYLEANHDVNMLMVGAYPYALKQRIIGAKGHLSNENSAKLICELLHDKLKNVFLAHLSKENNYAELAYETVRYEVEGHLCGKAGPAICVAKRDMPTEAACL